MFQEGTAFLLWQLVGQYTIQLVLSACPNYCMHTWCLLISTMVEATVERQDIHNSTTMVTFRKSCTKLSVVSIGHDGVVRCLTTLLK